MYKSTVFAFNFNVWSTVALNVQTAGLEMDLNDGMFSQNNCCGYVLKPEILRNSGHFDPELPETRKDYCPLSLTIQALKPLLIH